MKFKKDILIIDFEGLKEPVQIGAVLLDKETLVEKDSFSTYIFADLKDKIKVISGISQETLKGAPTQAKVGQIIFEKFGTDILIGAWVAKSDIKNFKKIIEAAGLDFNLYDYHILDIWPAAYIYLIKQGYNGGMRSEEIFKEFGAKPRDLHDALEDCRIVADVLREIVLYGKIKI
ncbi:MAG: exonuclease domain-containing protein [Candidatus Pacebacteria bacterium]|nr:exonuclease domain-containing protein [Candidatus Paceibacterota bacterium]